ncbi:putative FAST kinase domain-containing protein 5 isoform X1 [Apostichopus japonicus]|uniref:Putative FAST kinase domain-containing protein 5 isoform X1 n=1 Tax=Stichopus japonicus TaxID=307972 RepID=A0A2G8K5A2_STIJA|nr:putative FAST kinase domain-containing protein 5 isoform X1 [Apostichopus japonicus]
MAVLFLVKDIWMLLWAFGRVNYSPPDSADLFDGLVEQLTKNEKSFLRYPMQQIRSLIALCFLDIYPLELINRTFDRTFLKACEDYNFDDIYKQLVILDNSVRIERPEYNGNRLPQEFRRRSLSIPHGTNLFIPEQRSETKFILETLTRVVGGREYLKTSPILPHIRTPGDVQVDLSGDGIPEMSVDEHRLSLPQTLDDSSQSSCLSFGLRETWRLLNMRREGVFITHWVVVGTSLQDTALFKARYFDNSYVTACQTTTSNTSSAEEANKQKRYSQRAFDVHGILWLSQEASTTYYVQYC